METARDVRHVRCNVSVLGSRVSEICGIGNTRDIVTRESTADTNKTANKKHSKTDKNNN